MLNVIKQVRTSRHQDVDRLARLGVLFNLISGARYDSDTAPVGRAKFEIDPARIASFLPILRKSLEACRHDGRLINVWSVAGLKRNEVRTSAVLGWVLDSRGSHGFGSVVMRELLNSVGRLYPDKNFGSFRLGERPKISVEHSAFQDIANRVDIAIEGENCVVFIEVKIDAPEGRDQLVRYVDLAQKKATALGKPEFAVLYLCQTRGKARLDNVYNISWKDLGRAIMAGTSGEQETTMSALLLRQFAFHIKTLH